MKLKKKYLRVIKNLGIWSEELAISTDWSKDGFSEADYKAWLKSVSRFLSLMLKNSPRDLIEK